MSTWTERMHRRAATIGNVVTSCGHPSSVSPCSRRLDKVRFGVPLNEVCKNDIPGPLLVLILKLNKEAPTRKDVFRAPGHQGNMKKLIHFLQTGRLVNMDSFSVYTIASVLKMFLRKIPGGVFGKEGEEQLFIVIQLDSIEQQRDQVHKLITSLPIYTQRLLVLLFGTFRVVAVNNEKAQTGMSSEALGVSVAPSFFQSCVSDGKMAKMEDVLRFKIATKVIKFVIDNFGVSNLFGKENYQFYARITGRILKVEEDWIFSFRYPPATIVSRQLSLEAENTWLQYECEKWGLKLDLQSAAREKESRSTHILIDVPPCIKMTSSLEMISENAQLESHTRLSVSLEENRFFQVSKKSSSNGSRPLRHTTMTLDELRDVNRYAESTKSLSYLPQVHERQTARMRTRSEWFLMPVEERFSVDDDDSAQLHILCGLNRSLSGNIASGHCTSDESIKLSNLHRMSPREKPYLFQNSRRKNKEKGVKSRSVEYCKSHSLESMQVKSTSLTINHQSKDIKNTEKTCSVTENNHNSVEPNIQIGPQDCTEMDVQTIHVTLTYKPRI